MRPSPLFTALLVCVAACSPATAQDSGQLEASTYVPAQLVERSNPKYPSSALFAGKEGWVMLSFVISPNGEVTEPMIEDSSGVEAFEQAALRAVESWKYRPAAQDGESVEQAMTKTRIQFQLEDKPDGASPSFVGKYRRIMRLLDEKDFASVVLHARALDIAASIATFERLRDARTARRADFYEQVIANLQPSYERLLQLVNGDDLLVVKATVGEFDYWVHDLLRRSFSVADVAGRLDALDIRCQRGTRRYNAVPVDTVWTVPPSWGACGAYIKGDPGTTFAFQEHPRSFVPAPRPSTSRPPRPMRRHDAGCTPARRARRRLF
jgi:TonB family protein